MQAARAGREWTTVLNFDRATLVAPTRLDLAPPVLGATDAATSLACTETLEPLGVVVGAPAAAPAAAEEGCSHGVGPARRCTKGRAAALQTMWECVYCRKRWPKDGPAAVEQCVCGAQRGVLGRQANNTRELARLDSRVKQKKGRALNAA